MNQSEPVGLGHGVSQQFYEPGRALGCPWCAVEPLVQAATIEVLELEEGKSIDSVDAVDLDDVRVPQSGDGLGLGEKPIDRDGIGMGARRIILRAQGRSRLSPWAR